MRVLFTHNNFPAQFRHMAEYLGRTPGHQVVFATKTPREEWVIPGVTKAVFKADKAETGPPYAPGETIENGLRHGVGLLRLCKHLKNQGFVPDVMVGHSGWGQTLFLKDVFPDTAFVGYYEWYYRADSAESLFDGQQRNESQLAHLRLRNTAILHDLVACDAGVTPTAWQRQQFPPEFHPKLNEIHDGINTQYFIPHENGLLPPDRLDIPSIDLTGAGELLTYCSRGMEPYRGFPQFYEALPAILEARPDCHVLIVGEDRVCYSPQLPENGSYVELMKTKVAVDESRVHFTGPLSYGVYKHVLQASSAHVYLTWPFVLSWSFLESLSCGCLVIGSDTEPVREVLRHEENGLVTDFHSPERIAESVITALAQQRELAHLRSTARQTVLDKYCLSKCLPRHLKLLAQAAGKPHTNNKQP